MILYSIFIIAMPPMIVPLATNPVVQFYEERLSEETEYRICKEPEMKIAYTVEEFVQYRGLCNEGKDPCSITWTDCPKSDFLTVWSQEVKKDNKIKVSCIRPEFENRLKVLIKKIYQFGLKNNEARTIFARAFAWQHTRRAEENPGKYMLDWATFAFERIKISNRNKRHKTDMEEIALKNISMGVSSLETDMLGFEESISRIQNSIRELEFQKIRVEGLMAGFDEAAASVSDKLKKTKVMIEDLVEVCPDEDQTLGKLCQDESKLGLSLLTILKRKRQADNSASLDQQLTDLRTELQAKIAAVDDYKVKVKNLQYLGDNFMSTSIVKPCPGSLLVINFEDGCQVCGFAFSPAYSMFVQLVCGHKYHLFCFQQCVENLQCMVCKRDIPRELYAELGYLDFLPIKESAEDPAEDDAEEEQEDADIAQGQGKRPLTRSMTSPQKVSSRKRRGEDQTPEDATADDLDLQDNSPQKFVSTRKRRGEDNTDAADDVDLQNTSPQKVSTRKRRGEDKTAAAGDLDLQNTTPQKVVSTRRRRGEEKTTAADDLDLENIPPVEKEGANAAPAVSDVVIVAKLPNERKGKPKKWSARPPVATKDVPKTGKKRGPYKKGAGAKQALKKSAKETPARETPACENPTPKGKLVRKFAKKSANVCIKSAQCEKELSEATLSNPAESFNSSQIANMWFDSATVPAGGLVQNTEACGSQIEDLCIDLGAANAAFETIGAVPTMPSIPLMATIPTMPVIPPMPIVHEMPVIPPMPIVPTMPVIPPMPIVPEMPIIPQSPKVADMHFDESMPVVQSSDVSKGAVSANKPEGPTHEDLTPEPPKSDEDSDEEEEDMTLEQYVEKTVTLNMPD